MAYRLAEIDPLDSPGIGPLFVALVGTGRVLEVDLGVPPGDAVLTFSGRDPYLPAADPTCTSVRILRRQPLEHRAMAYARACARYMVWAYANEPWAIECLDDIALALVMPEPRFSEESRTFPPARIARAYRVGIEAVLRRQRFLRGTRDSSERPIERQEHA